MCSSKKMSRYHESKGLYSLSKKMYCQSKISRNIVHPIYACRVVRWLWNSAGALEHCFWSLDAFRICGDPITRLLDFLRSNDTTSYHLINTGLIQLYQQTSEVCWSYPGNIIPILSNTPFLIRDYTEGLSKLNLNLVSPTLPRYFLVNRVDCDTFSHSICFPDWFNGMYII